MKAWLVVVLGCGSTATAVQPPLALHHPRGVHPVQIGTAANNACARMSDGTVRCWGDNMLGQVGDGTTIERHTPVQVFGIDDAIDLKVDGSTACVLRASGDVSCWGALHFLDVREDHSGPVAWPDDARHVKPRRIGHLAGAKTLWVARDGDGCARWRDGTTKCWGDGAGYLAAGMPTMYGTEPAATIDELAGVLDYTLTESLGCAVMPDHTARCWGRNDHGEAGDGRVGGSRRRPVTVKGLTDVVQIAILREAACALRGDGTVWCWGNNDSGQLGDGTTTDRATPAQLPLRGVAALSAASVHACALHADGRVSCWGNGTQGTLGDGGNGEHSPPVSAKIDRVVQIAAADFHTCALRDDATVWCWGGGSRGVLGDGYAADRHVPTEVQWTAPSVVSHGLPSGVHVATAAVGGIHTCAALDNGTVRCWGRNDGGIVDGVGRAKGTVASYTQPIAVPGITDARALSLDTFQSYAVRADGTVVEWGHDQPVKPTDMKPVVDFVAGDGIACVRRADGTGRCGDHDGVETIGDVVQVASYGVFACALRKDGTVACMGYGGAGGLGDGTFGQRHQFGPVKKVKDAVQIAVGAEHACARLRDGSVMCWGDGYQAAAGTKTGPLDAPIAVRGLSDIVDIQAGLSFTCARRADGATLCWGHWGLQTLGGDRDAWTSAAPVELPWLRGARQLFLGFRHSCAILGDGDLACWGENNAGQLGDGTMDDRAEAVKVVW